MDEYNKYFDSILMYFYVDDNQTLLDSIERKLNDPADFYYNYVQEDVDLRLKNLFDHLVQKYVATNNNEFYKSLWNIIHCVPLIMNTNNKMVLYFYKQYITKSIGCVNCIMHYIYNISEVQDSIFVNKSLLFDHFVELHNEINIERGKKTESSDIVKTYLVDVLTTNYNLQDYIQ
jgi:hypothetical protein